MREVSESLNSEWCWRGGWVDVRKVSDGFVFRKAIGWYELKK